jgi:hypothetical protein
MGVKRVVVRIERVVLRGFGELDARAYRAALQSELARHLASPNALAVLASAPALRPALHGTLELGRESKAQAAGECTARLVAGVPRG